MHGQQTVRLPGEPRLRFFVLAGRTMAVPATAADPMLTAAIIALVDRRTQLARPATSDRSEHFAVLQRHVVASLRQVVVTVLTQTIGNGQHHGRLPFRPLEDPVDRLTGVGFGRVGQVQIDHRGLQAAVPEQLLDHLRKFEG